MSEPAINLEQIAADAVTVALNTTLRLQDRELCQTKPDPNTAVTQFMPDSLAQWEVLLALEKITTNVLRERGLVPTGSVSIENEAAFFTAKTVKDLIQVVVKAIESTIEK